MTEAEWQASSNTYDMLDHLNEKVSDRKLMLFSVACLRRIWDVLRDPRSQRLVETIELEADNHDNEEIRASAIPVYEAYYQAREVGDLQDDECIHEAIENASCRGWFAAICTATSAAEAASVPLEEEKVAQVSLLRDIFGNPFRPAGLDRDRLNPNVVTLARTIYDTRCFDRMSELGAALEQTGCSNTTILDHSRQPGPHVRGCWLLDLILGKDDSMTEANWLASRNPNYMWWFLRPKPSERKKKLLVAACCRRIWHQLPEPCRRALEVFEFMTDGLAMVEEWSDAQRIVRTLGAQASCQEIKDMVMAVEFADRDPIVSASFAAKASGQTDEPAAQAALLRDIVGNPFRQCSIDQDWLTAEVRKLAQSIYEDKAFVWLPLLRIALEEAGCADSEILDHCSSSGPHVRGCWVVDLILGKSFVPTRPRPPAFTASEWEVCTDTDRMVYSLHRMTSGRKLRLFAVACCQRILNRMRDERSRKGVAVAEHLADGLVNQAELDFAREEAGAAFNAENGPDWERGNAARAAYYSLLDEPTFLGARHEVRTSIRWSNETNDAMVREEVVASEVTYQASLLRDVVGNPFRTTPILENRWLTPQVVTLAQKIYYDRAFDLLPILANALEEAGCTNAEILEHCRGPGPHVRGCWVVDLILGKE